MISYNTGQRCLFANLQTENGQNVLRFDYTGHSYAIYSHPCPHPARLGRVFTVTRSVHERSSM